MKTRLLGFVRVFCLLAKTLLGAALVLWLAMAPLVWILRDGLAVGMIETSGVQGALKFLVGWGVPTLILVALLVATVLFERLLALSAEVEAEEAGSGQEQ